jgi:hypothetical protein
VPTQRFHFTALRSGAAAYDGREMGVAALFPVEVEPSLVVDVAVTVRGAFWLLARERHASNTRQGAYVWLGNDGYRFVQRG